MFLIPHWVAPLYPAHELDPWVLTHTRLSAETSMLELSPPGQMRVSNGPDGLCLNCQPWVFHHHSCSVFLLLSTINLLEPLPGRWSSPARTLGALVALRQIPLDVFTSCHHPAIPGHATNVSFPITFPSVATQLHTTILPTMRRCLSA